MQAMATEGLEGGELVKRPITAAWTRMTKVPLCERTRARPRAAAQRAAGSAWWWATEARRPARSLAGDQRDRRHGPPRVALRPCHERSATRRGSNGVRAAAQHSRCHAAAERWIATPALLLPQRCINLVRCIFPCEGGWSDDCVAALCDRYDVEKSGPLSLGKLMPLDYFGEAETVGVRALPGAPRQHQPTSIHGAHSRVTIRAQRGRATGSCPCGITRRRPRASCARLSRSSSSSRRHVAAAAVAATAAAALY